MAMNDNAKLAVEKSRVENKARIAKIDKDIIRLNATIWALESKKARMLVEISDYDKAVPIEQIEAITAIEK